MMKIVGGEMVFRACNQPAAALVLLHSQEIHNLRLEQTSIDCAFQPLSIFSKELFTHNIT